MIGRKIMLVRGGEATEMEQAHAFAGDIEKIKHITKKHTREYGELLLVAIVRFFVQTSNFVKERYKETKVKVKNIKPGRQEVNKFLKTISSYKQKIREIKHKIKEEEKAK